MRILLIACCLLVASSKQAQRPFEGRIHYQVEYLSFPDGMEGAELALPQQMTLLAKGSSYRMQQSSALGGPLVWIHPAKIDTVYQVFDFMERQVFLAAPVGSGAHKHRVVAKEDEREIAGWKCEEYYLQSAEGNHQTVWVNEKYRNPLKVDFPGLVYLPLQFDLWRNGIHMRFSAKRVVEEQLDGTYFTLPERAVRIREADLQRILN